MDRHKGNAALFTGFLAVFCLLLGLAAWQWNKPADRQDAAQQQPVIQEGPVIAATLAAGPFDLHRRYRSMEGPFVYARFKAGQLIGSTHANCPESDVGFVEALPKPGLSMSMDGKGRGFSVVPEGLADIRSQPRTLYWLKGMKLEVFDEQGKPMPTAEFACHFSLNCSPGQRNQLFPFGERCSHDRLLVMTQGQTRLIFPPGFAVPVASDEDWNVGFQAVNRTTDRRRRITQKATFYFLKDSDLYYPVTALYMKYPVMEVAADANVQPADAGGDMGMAGCIAQSSGAIAPNSGGRSVRVDASGHTVTSHWVVPPGRHVYSELINRRVGDFSLVQRKLRFAFLHAHPCCTEASLVRCDGGRQSTVCKINVINQLNPGLQILHIDTVQPHDPIVIEKGALYELRAIYDNPTGKALDSMVAMGMFFEDPSFRRPQWALPNNPAPNCSVPQDDSGQR